MRIPLNTSSRDIYGIARDILVNKTRFMDLKQGNVTRESYRFKYSKNKPVLGKAKIGFVVYPIGFKLSLSDRHDLQNAILADAFKNNKPKLKGVALSGGYYYPYIRHEEDETYSVFDKCKSISEAKSLLAKGIEYNDALRRKNNGYSNGLRSRTNAVITNNGSALEKSETTNTVRLDSETEKIADTKADNSTNRENNSKQP